MPDPRLLGDTAFELRCRATDARADASAVLSIGIARGLEAEAGARRAGCIVEE